MDEDEAVVEVDDAVVCDVIGVDDVVDEVDVGGEGAITDTEFEP